MAIAFGRMGRFKAYIKSGIAGFFRGIKNSIVRKIRGGGSGSNSGTGAAIALEVSAQSTREKAIKYFIRVALFAGRKRRPEEQRSQG